MLKSLFAGRVLRVHAAVLLVVGLIASASRSAQDGKGPGKTKQPDFIPAGYDDYQNMLDQLGIKKVRKGRDARAKDTSAEATANPYKDSMPDLMTFKDGTKVKTADQWPKRRAEIVEDFEREVYGRVPKNVPEVKWEVTRTAEGESGGIATVTRTLVGNVDNSAFPQLEVAIQASFTVPRHAAGRVPIILQFSFGGPPRPPNPPNLWTQQALDKAWAYGTIVPNSIQPDNSRLREGIIGLTNKGQPRRPEDWGALRAWAWGVSRLIDYFQAHPDSGVDPAKVCITGVSRYGKAALVATAFDTRIAAGFVASSGCGGAKLFRRDFGELLENVASRGGYHWMAGNFLKYAADEAPFGKKTVADLPVDQHELIALCAPRPCFISYGVPEKGDPNWVDAHGSFMAAVLAGPAYRLVGKRDLGTPGDYLTDKMPPVNTLQGGELAWRQHDGGHTNVPNFPTFYEWAGRCISTPGLDRPAWELKAVSLGADEKEATKKLNELAADGWQYVGPLPNGLVAFKRPNDPFQPKTKWVGTFTRHVAGAAASNGGRFELTVLSRDGKTFTARVGLAENVVFVAKGTIEDGKIEWRGKDIKLEKAGPAPGGPRHDYSGQLGSNRLALSYSGVVAADGKTPVSGTAVADLVK